MDTWAAVTVPGRRNIADDRPGDVLDLSRTKLSGARLPDARLALGAAVRRCARRVP